MWLCSVESLDLGVDPLKLVVLTLKGLDLVFVLFQ